ncbi:flagellar assembly peptidoglycan hydrolase FlgJ [Wenzhouxiangella sp. AB-CW3]|uniref:flagellar assembly peptidoglycan hydrolase FlgJ n=1 Tax=Wenzhouxiangella sp. AB-CW3 TaxID=2771012 RepID=UPI00168A68A9|nr:flagellar assembly peptidoglycan hydrolase FlgJ [Wenzhouxiangella sp. AB-CW3]QOC21221.1 flagellar assembly peptidoglycan hydrolase FlgJ [Wenzhouxiangella sp. AB-CW3]
MSVAPTNSAFFGDTSALANLRPAARENSPEAVREVAEQFEALFVQMMLKEMRSATIQGGLFDSFQMDTYHEMFDKQVAMDMARSGGLGLADMMVRQLSPEAARQEGAEATDPEEMHWPESVVPARPELPVAPPVEPAPAARASESPAYRDEAFSSPAEFVSTLAPLARRAAAELDVPAEAIIAQSALETGWGRHVMHHGDGRPAWNLFGIKAGSDWDGETVSVMTTEVIDGEVVRERAEFRAYDSPDEAVADYTRFLGERARYRDVPGTGNDPRRFAQALQAAGYATDPQYADKITRIVDSVRPHFGT